MSERVVLLLGRRDEPTDGVADYCERLREAGPAHGLEFEIVTLPWAEKGWRTALADLRKEAQRWRGQWVFLQFTTLAWSRRGFPLRAPTVLRVLRRGGVRPGVVFHDFAPLRGSGIVGSAREYCHLRVLRQLYAASEMAVFTVAVNRIEWLPLRRDKAVFIPVGANCPELPNVARSARADHLTVAVYSITGGSCAEIEIADIDHALRAACAAMGPIRLVLFGRGSKEAEPTLRLRLEGVPVEIESLGLISPERVNDTLSRVDVLLFVRGQISSRRGTAIAGIAAGLPIVSYSGSETSWPVTEAGILAVPTGERHALAMALVTVLSDDELRSQLASRSRAAHAKYFSWGSVTGQFAAALQNSADTHARQ